MNRLRQAVREDVPFAMGCEVVSGFVFAQLLEMIESRFAVESDRPCHWILSCRSLIGGKEFSVPSRV